MAKLDIRIKESGREGLRIELGGRSRLLYFIIFLFLSLSVFLSIDFSYDFTSERIGGTLFTFILILFSLGVTLTVRSFTIDKKNGVLTKNLGLPFGMYSRILKSYRLGSRPRFIIKSLGGIYPQSAEGVNRLGMTAGTAMAKGRNKFSLYLETEEDTVMLCDRGSKADMEIASKYMSSYLGIPVISEV